MTTTPTVVDVATLDDLEPIRTDWARLAWTAPQSSFFQSPEWFAAWWDTIGGRPPCRVALWRDEGDPVALAAMAQVSERLHRRVPMPVSFWTNAGGGIGAADHIGPLVGPDATDAAQPDPAVATAVGEWLAGLNGAVLLRNVQPSLGAAVPLGAETLVETQCPRLAIPQGDEPIGRSAKFRKRLRRNSRILRERGIEFRAVDGPDITDHMIDRLMAMHEVRSEDRGWGSTFTPERIEFHRRLIASATTEQGPGLMTATADGEVVGVLYGFWWNGSYSYFQTGWDPAYWELSLGSALVFEMIQVARDRGATLFDFLRGPEEYKYRFGAEDQVDVDWLLARGAAGKALATKARIR